MPMFSMRNAPPHVSPEVAVPAGSAFYRAPIRALHVGMTARYRGGEPGLLIPMPNMLGRISLEQIARGVKSVPNDMSNTGVWFPLHWGEPLLILDFREGWAHVKVLGPLPTYVASVDGYVPLGLLTA
jgi:hypothetical protein